MGDLSNYIKKIRQNKALKSRAGGLQERTVRHFLKQLGKVMIIHFYLFLNNSPTLNHLYIVY
jgi:hypothetical protein